MNRVATPRAWPWFLAATGVVLVDRLTKLLMLGWLRPGDSVEVTGFFNLVVVFNRGAAFSFLADAQGWQTPFFAGVALIAAAVVSWMLWRHPARTLLCSGLALILGRRGLRRRVAH
ncbi:MAG: signal peptidase II, partial [Burkholderiales bacterium]